MPKKQQSVSTAPGCRGARTRGDHSDLVAVHGDCSCARTASRSTRSSRTSSACLSTSKIARAMRLVERDGDVLTLVAESASFGSLFPTAKIEMTATLLPVEAIAAPPQPHIPYTGDEELLLVDHPEGTRINYTYFVTVHHAGSSRCTRGWSRRSAFRTGSGRSSIRSNRWQRRVSATAVR